MKNSKPIPPNFGIRTGKFELQFLKPMVAIWYDHVVDVVRETTGNETTDVAAITQFVELQNMTIEQFCEHYDDNMALARLTQ